MSNCRIEHRWNGFAVYPVEEPVIIETTMSREGVVVTKRPATSVLRGLQTDIFNTYWSETYKCWLTDINFGFRRWSGHKTTRQIRAALRKCGFDKATIDKTLKAAQRSA
jgi:hypothetical protein